jgi:anti-sigma factor RsiW
MNENSKPDMTDWEEQINALLEGDLDPQEAEALKAAATDDQMLARAIVEAYQLQRAMEYVQGEKAPASLQRKLKQIPRQERPAFFQPRWAAAFAVVPLVIGSVFVLKSLEPTPVQLVPAPDAEVVKLEQARQDLALAFAYIGKVSDVTSNRIGSELGGEMKDAVAGSIFKTINQQKFL